MRGDYLQVFTSVRGGDHMRLFICREHWKHKDLRYTTFYYDKVVPTPHCSGNWEHGFKFNNDYFLQLAVV